MKIEWKVPYSGDNVAVIDDLDDAIEFAQRNGVEIIERVITDSFIVKDLKEYRNNEIEINKHHKY